ncbi:MAG: hypothetical protein ACREP9_01755 [Candidatus Dormibacteraceae bacterium]
MESVCSECLAVIPVVLEQYRSGVYLKRTCPEHGHQRYLIESSQKFFDRQLSARALSSGQPTRRSHNEPKAEAEVSQILSDDSYLDKFKGKDLLKGLYVTLSLGQTSYEQFCYAVAQKCKNSQQTKERVDDAFGALDSLVNDQLANALLA